MTLHSLAGMGFVEHQLILDIYDAALEPKKWPDVLRRLSEAINARGAFIFDIENRHGVEIVNATCFSSNYDEALVRQYLVDHQKMEMEDQAQFARHSKQLDSIELVKDEVLAPSREALMQRANAKAMLDYGIFYRMGGLLNKDRTTADRFALQFTESAGFPTGENLTNLQLLLPHLAKALNIGRHTSRLKQEASILSAGYNGLRMGIALLDHRGELVFSNNEFQRQLDKYGVFQIGNDRRLIARLASGNDALNNLLSNIDAHGRFGARPRKEAVVQPLNHNESALCIEVCPLTKPDFFNGEKLNGYAIFSLDTNLAVNFDMVNMAKFFDLTPTEREILELLSQGMTNSEICEQRNRSRETVNTQVKAILQKTMSSNRTQLMRLALQFSTQIMLNEDDGSAPLTQMGEGMQITAN